MRTRYLMGLFLALSVAVAPPMGFSQAAASAESHSATTAAATAKQAASRKSSDVRAGTRIDAALVSSIDAKTAKPGDRVEARVLKNVKQNGRVVVHKGDVLVGKVTEAHPAAAGEAGSQMSVAFDHMTGAQGETQLNTVLTSVFSANTQQQEQMGLDTSPMMQPMPPAGGAVRGGGGLLGGVGSTVGTTVGSVGAIGGGAGSTLAGASGNLSSASSANAGAGSNLGLATPARAIHLQSSAGAENQTGMNSMLSTRHGDLRLDSGTRMQFRVAGNGQGRPKHR
jgi:hypothetical protein